MVAVRAVVAAAVGSDQRSILGKFAKLKEQGKVVMLGLDAAGKTTILYRLHIGEVLSTISTIGFNVKKVQYKNVVFTVWDVGDQEKVFVDASAHLLIL